MNSSLGDNPLYTISEQKISCRLDFRRAPLKKNTLPTELMFIDDTLGIDLLHLSDYGPIKVKSYRYTLVVFDIFPKLDAQ